ncbi:DUF6428 family protein [Jiulongibacter sediminis]|uniref:Uncharacterized protein n=1 Tax=Jiulongibacter sediminis TaxID=1605367 RepID=A0A0P7BCU9_9BACT|nr:DUF6428 family protein [Jiulongibacter sediminis]KPM48457.1 hypothetical protein AFM12_07425 [Jiulongibacter sediminis]TBX24995.1 hypothetical protein TK44_07430 [Jiulongibacter sediminis]
MKLSEIKNHLAQLKTIAFQLPDGSLVEEHFHVTEVGEVTKHFIDCGGTVRHEKVVNFQLWSANDYNHRLHPEKLVKIIELSEKTLGMGDLEIEVEYQGDSIMKFGLDFDGETFLLTSKQTDCLAKDKCGIPEKKVVKLSSLGAHPAANGCTPGGGCC